ncbi:MAG: hypothetical protein HXL10_01335 [Candidatus Nanosynbacter sp.]|nr:hypothetical protein [Candidatus Nanosynbacter sp.]
MGPKNMNSAPSGNNNVLSARDQYYKEQHDARVAQFSQFKMNNRKESNGENVDRGESDRKLELRHQFNQVKLEADTFLKMQAGLGLMSEKEVREYKDNLNKQEKNALEYMRDGGEGSLVPMENLMKRSLDQISDFEAKIQATPEYQEMEQKKALAKKGLDMIKERRENDANFGVNNFRFKEKVYKMQANLAEKEFLSKAFSAEDKKNTNEALNAATEKFNKLDEEAIKLTRELKAGGRKLTFEDYQKIDAAWGASAAAEAKMNEIKNADRKEIALDFAQNQYDKIKKGEQLSGVEGSFLSKFNVLTSEDTIEKIEPTVKDKIGKVAAKIAESGSVLLDVDDQIWMQKLPKDQLEQLQKMLENQKNGNSKTGPGKEDFEKDKKKGFVASVVEKIKKHGEGIKRFMMVVGICALAIFAAHGGNKFTAKHNAAGEKGIDKDGDSNGDNKFIGQNTAVEKNTDNNGDTDGNVEEALAEHDTGSEVDSLVKGNSFNIMVDSKETKIVFDGNINPEFPGFTDSRRSGNDMTFVDRSGLESLKEQGASSEALGAEGMKEILDTMENPNMTSYLGASFGAFEKATSPTAVNDITYMIQHGDAEAQVAIKKEANNTIANFLEGSTLKLGSIMNETYQSGYASNNGGEGNLQVDMALDKDGVFHKGQAVEFVYAENKDGKNIMDMNVRDGFKENSLRALGVIEKNASDGEVMNTMSSVRILGINVKCGQIIFQYLKTAKKEATKTVDKTDITTSTVTQKKVGVKGEEPAPKNEISTPKPKNETPPSAPKNETPPSIPKENPKIPGNNVNEGKTNTASANEEDIKLSETGKEAGLANREGNDEHNVQTNTPGSEITDAGHFDQMTREADKQDLAPNSFITTQDNSQGIVHQEGVATEKQVDAENKSVLPEESRSGQSNPDGSVLKEDKVVTAQDRDSLMSVANADNATAHESGQTRTVNIDVNSEQ